jgi:hypothetical protein
MSKSEEIINDWHEAKKLYLKRFPINTYHLTMVEMVGDLIDYIGEMKEEVSELKMKIKE